MYRPISILLADDDPDDCQFATEALAVALPTTVLVTVPDGAELLAYLYRRGVYATAGAAHRPDLILLDLHMPGMGGLEALQHIKESPVLRRIPVVVLTTFRADEDVFQSYDLGANSFIRKPANFDTLVEVMRGLGAYWFTMVKLPHQSVA